MDNENVEVKQSLAEIRREQRKRKILENANNRLDKIAGKELNGSVRDGGNYIMCNNIYIYFCFLNLF